MTALQKAIDNVMHLPAGTEHYDEERDYWLVDEAVVDAARLVANPNYGAAQDAWASIPMHSRYDYMDNIRLVVAAALTLGDTDER